MRPSDRSCPLLQRDCPFLRLYSDQNGSPYPDQGIDTTSIPLYLRSNLQFIDMRISKSTKPINYFALVILAFTIIASCQKQAVVPARRLETATAILGPPPPPVLLVWSPVAKLPLPNDTYGYPITGLRYPQGFTINGKGYVFGGITIDVEDGQAHPGQTWEFDPASNSWSQQASFPAGYGGGPIESENFVIGNSAYICNGTTNQNWQYNQATNTWTQKSDIPSVARYWGTGMSINGKGYIGLGSYQSADGDKFSDAADWWQYDPTSDTWTKKSEFSGGKREGAAGFVVNGKGYVATGFSLSKNSYYTDCWQYDPVGDSWSRMADFPGPGRTQCVGLSGVQTGYVATGANSTRSFNDCWQYVPATNAWHGQPSIGGIYGPEFDEPAAFSIGTTLYLGAGYVSQPNSGLTFWSYANGQ
jgi:N-acetylneuraminic acid mutarotase